MNSNRKGALVAVFVAAVVMLVAVGLASRSGGEQGVATTTTTPATTSTDSSPPTSTDDTRGTQDTAPTTGLVQIPPTTRDSQDPLGPSRNPSTTDDNPPDDDVLSGCIQASDENTLAVNAELANGQFIAEAHQSLDPDNYPYIGANVHASDGTVIGFGQVWIRVDGKLYAISADAHAKFTPHLPTGADLESPATATNEWGAAVKDCALRSLPGGNK